MKFKNFRSLLSLFICLLFFLPHFQKVSCGNPDADLILLDMNIWNIQKDVDKFHKEYLEIISQMYTLGEKYSETIINWRLDVLEYYNNLRFNKKNICIAAYFIFAMHCKKFNVYPSVEWKDDLYNLKDIKAHLITPSNKKLAFVPHISDDPNGSIQALFVYKNKEPYVICI